MSYTIHDMPETERPRERLQRHGTEALATAELVAIILGSGMRGLSVLQLAQQIVSKFGSLQKLSDATIEELCQIKGMGTAKAIQLKAALGLGMRVSRQVSSPKYHVEHPLNVYHLLRDELEHEKREHFVVVLLDAKGFVLGHHVVAIGTLSNSLVHPREVFYPAIRHKASSLVLAHNHPSGDPTPSTEDIEVTANLIQVGATMGIPIHDHIIIGHDCYLSMRQKKHAAF